MQGESLFEDLSELLERIVLVAASPDDSPLPPDHLALRQVATVLERNAHLSDQTELYEAQVRLALHFAPRAALEYDPSNPTPRHVLIRKYMVDVLGRRQEFAERASREIAVIVRNLSTSRSPVAHHREDLLRAQRGRCAHCGVLLWPEPRPVRPNDPFKNYAVDLEEWLTPEVDHKMPITSLGTNKPENLQVLCRLCNQGKGDGFPLQTRDELRWCRHQPENADFAHRRRLLYWVLRRDGLDGRFFPTEGEVSIRLVNEQGGLVRSNLEVFRLE